MAAALASSFSLLRASRLARPYAIRNNAFSYRSFGSLCSFSAPLRPKRFVRHITASSDEEAAAKAAVDTGGPTIFDKIIAKEIPSDIVYEDDKVLAFRDINPQAPVHILIIPKLRNGLTQLVKVLAFRDIKPQTPVHILIIPKLRNGLIAKTLADTTGRIIDQMPKPVCTNIVQLMPFSGTEIMAEAKHGEILGQLLYASKIVADKEGIAEGFRVVINNGPDACQSVYHLHLHVLGGRQMNWPPG